MTGPVAVGPAAAQVDVVGEARVAGVGDQPTLAAAPRRPARGARACAASAGRGWRGRGRRRPTRAHSSAAAFGSLQSTRTWVDVVMVDGSRSISAQRWWSTSSGAAPVLGRGAGVVPVVGEAGDGAQRAVRSGAADDDRRVGPLHRLRLAAGLAQREVAAVEVADLLGEERLTTSRPSSKRSKRSLSGGRSMPRASDSSWFQPAPRPSSRRPSLMTSRVAAMLASTDGCRYGMPVTSTPTRRRLVAWARAVERDPALEARARCGRRRSARSGRRSRPTRTGRCRRPPARRRAWRRRSCSAARS